MPELKADPSQGSHFFQQITTHNLPYLTVTHGGSDVIHGARIQAFKTLHETSFLKHVQSPAPLRIKCDGRSSQCAVLPPEV
ncbi:MAG: hypothetical protein P8X55_16415 [Desulfosarcinaceae bacterium]